jgi:hypothetical protein
MDIEDFEAPNSWISVKAIRDAADLKSCLHKKASSTGSETTKTIKNEASGSKSLKNSNLKTNSMVPELLQSISSPKMTSFGSETKYLSQISRLNQEITILSSSLKQANTIISSLTTKLNELTQQHVLHIQALQERHEQKIKRFRQELNTIIKEIQTKNTNFMIEMIVKEHQSEFTKQNQNFQNEIAEINSYFLKEIERKDLENTRQANMLKEYFFKLISSLKNKFVSQLESMEKKYKKCLKALPDKKRKIFMVNEDESTVVDANDPSSDTSQEIALDKDFISCLNVSFSNYKDELDRHEIFQYEPKKNC